MAQNSPLLGPSGASPGSTPLPEATSPDATPAAPPSPPSFPDKMLSQAQGRFDAVEKAFKQLGRIRKGLDTLVEKGDSVTSDDVLDEMATLVAHGADPKVLAAIIAGNTQAGVQPMPPQGEALAGWLTAVERDIVAPSEAQLRPAMALAGHQLGVAAMHKLVDMHAKAQAAGAQAAQPNPLGASPEAPLPSPTSVAPALLQ